MSAEMVHRGGITTAADPAGITGMTPEQTEAYYKIAATAPFTSYMIIDPRLLGNENKQSVVEIIKGIEKNNKANVVWSNNQFKFFVDGAMFSQGGRMSKPYIGGEHDGELGEWVTAPDKIFDLWKPFWKNGIDAHIHVNGDAGVQLIIDTQKKLQREFPRTEHRTVLEHFGYSRLDQIEEMAKLNITASVNPYYINALGDEYAKKGFGSERAQGISRTGSLGKYGLRFSLHSDYMMAPAEPLLLAWCAVNRTTLSGKVLGPDERITVDQAMHSITIDAAYSIKQENVIGSIKVGKKANFTILLENPYKVESNHIKDINIWGTIFEGKEFSLE
jgi:predicted amidohydrolase YtcJ